MHRTAMPPTIAPDHTVPLDVMETWYDRHSTPVFSLAHHMMENASATEDVVTEVFVAARRIGTSWDDEQCATNLLLLTRQVATRRLRLERARGSRGAPVPHAVAERPAAWPLETLDERTRDLVTAAYFGGCTLDELASLHSMTPTDVASKLRAAYRRLSQEIAR